MPHYSTGISNIGPPDWTKVRKIYQRLSDEFEVLLEPYAIHLSSHQKIMLDHLIIAIDRIDDFIDNIEDKTEREMAVTTIMQSIQLGPFLHQNSSLTASIDSNIFMLSTIVSDLGIQVGFERAAAEVFFNTEAKRFVHNRSELLEHIILEGKATAQLPISVLQLNKKEAFESFFTDLCVLMGIADLLVDLRKDYKTGLIQVVPSLFFQIQLLWILFQRSLVLFVKFPNKWSLLGYCIRFGWLLLREKE